MKTAKETIEFCNKRIDEMNENWDWIDYTQSDLIELLEAVVDFIDEPSPTQWAIRRLQEDAADTARDWKRRVTGKKWLEWYDGYRFKAIMSWINDD